MRSGVGLAAFSVWWLRSVVAGGSGVVVAVVVVVVVVVRGSGPYVRHSATGARIN